MMHKLCILSDAEKGYLQMNVLLPEAPCALLTFSSVCSISACVPNMVITVPADGLAPIGAGPSADTVMTLFVCLFHY